MQIKEIKKELRSNGLYEEILREPKDIYNWMDEAQLQIAKHHGNIGEFEIMGAEAWSGEEVPEDFLMVTEVRDNSDPSISVYYEISNTKPPEIFFNKDGDYTVYYYKIPEKLPKDNDEAELEVDDIFRDAVVAYCMYKYWQREAEGSHIQRGPGVATPDSTGIDVRMGPGQQAEEA